MGRKNTVWRKYIFVGERFADLVNGYSGEPLIDAEKLETLESFGIRTEEYAGRKREQEHDAIKLAMISGVYCIIGIEAQENIHYKMVTRSIGYALEAYERQLDEISSKYAACGGLRGDEFLSRMKKNDVIAPVIILVVYFGEEPWDAAVDLYELTQAHQFPEKLKNMLPNYRMNLLDVCRFEHLHRFQSDLHEVFGFLQRRKDRGQLEQFISENEQAFRNMREDAYDVIAAYGHNRILFKLKNICRREGDVYDMCQALDDIWKNGKKEGMKEGKKEGKKEGEERGRNRLNRLNARLIAENRLDDLIRATGDKKYQNKLFKMYAI